MGEDEIKRFQVTVPRTLYSQLDRLASEGGLRKTDVMRELIEGWVAERIPDVKGLRFRVVAPGVKPTVLAAFDNEGDALQYVMAYIERHGEDKPKLELLDGDRVRWKCNMPDSKADGPLKTIDESVRERAKSVMSEKFSDEEIDRFISAAANVDTFVSWSLGKYEGELANASSADELPDWNVAFAIANEIIEGGAAAVEEILEGGRPALLMSRECKSFCSSVMDYVHLSLKERFGERPNQIEKRIRAAQKIGGEYPYMAAEQAEREYEEKRA